MVKIIERIEGCYDVQKVEFGTVYRWRPGSLSVECDCGERLVLTASVTACGCGADHAAIIRGELGARRLDDAALHPWRYAGEREGAGIPG